ncbi:MAG: IS110 family transposase [Bacteroidia bacterium]
MKRETFWGLDISKKTIDLCIEESGKIIGQYVLPNSPSQVRMGISQYLAEQGLNWEDCVFCMEHTGIYTNALLHYLTANSQYVYVVNPLHLKKSMGLVRGKNDRVDAQRIARFIARNYTDLIAYTRPESALEVLKILSARRTQLVTMLAQVTVPTKELKGCVDKQLVKKLEKLEVPIVKSLTASIKELDKQIQQMIQESSRLRVLFKRICSVPGVGPVLGVALLVATHGFTRLTEARCLASFAGVAPFEHSSGSSIYRKAKVSVYADKKLKKLLHMAALRVITLKGELQDYYRRKCAQGKAPMTVINALRNKIIHRVCAVVKLEKNYQSHLVLS